MYCSNCGNKVDDNAYVCINCGVKLRNDSSSNVSGVVDKGGFGWGVLGFFIPIVGLILYLAWKKEKPKTAKAAGIGALVYVIFEVVLIIIGFCMGLFSGIFDTEENYNYDEYYYNFE